MGVFTAVIFRMGVGFLGGAFLVFFFAAMGCAPFLADFVVYSLDLYQAPL